jgi:Tol biopolymer transport system component
MRARGTNHRRLTEGSDAAWAPHGRKLVTTRDDNLFVYTFKTRAVEEIPLPEPVTAASDPAWSPDGRRIVVGRFSREADPQPVGLAVVPASGPRRVAETGELPEEYGGRWFEASGDTHPSWSPNGARIVAGPTWNRRGNGLSVGRTDGTRVRRIGGGLMWQPDWQPLP